MLKDIRKVIEKHFKDILFCVSILSLTVIFSNTLAQYIDKLFVSVDLYSLSFIIPFAVLVICIIAYTVYLWKNDFVPSKNLLFATYCFGLVLYRTKLNETTIFAYADIIFLLYLSQSVLLIKHVVRKHKLEEENNKANTSNGFISDTPVKDPKNDKKGYNSYALNIANKIKESHFENSFAIGINGKWGSGKTSMSNLIDKHLEDEEDIISIFFKPWNSNTPDAIIKDFFEILQDELSQYHSALSRLLIRYPRKLTSIDSNIITQTIEYAANYILDLDATNKVYDKINKALKDIDKKIIIYIDDLDRLEQSEIMEVIRLIRNTANFYNTFFIVTYDKDYVNKALKDAGIHNHEKFLEKIFQLEVDLPYYDKSQLINELKVKLKELFPKEITVDIENEVFRESDHYYTNILDEWLQNSRDVTRLCNSFVVNYSSVKDYVVFKEFLLIEVLRINYPSIYYDLYSRRKDFFDRKQDKYKFKKIKDETIPLEKYLEEKFETDNEKIYSFIRDIFYIDDLHDTELQNNNQDSIIKYKRFYIYFNYANFDGVLSYGEFIFAFEKDEEYFFDKIKEWVEKGLGREVSERFKNINYFENNFELEKYARAIILFFNLNGGGELLRDFRYKILKNKERIEKLYENNLELMMQNIFKPLNPKDIKNKLNFIHRSVVDDYFSEEENIVFQNTFLTLFNTLIKNSSKFNSSMAICVDIGYKLPQLKDDIIKRTRSFIIEKDHLQGFLLSTLCSGCSKDHIFKERIETIFTNLTEFEELLAIRKEQSKYVEEYLQLYNKCKESNFEDKFDFPFIHFPTIEEWEKGL